MLSIVYHSQFKKDYKLALKRGCKAELLTEVISLLAHEQPLPSKNKDHALTGNYKGFRECHIQPDGLLIYQLDKEQLVLALVRTGTHSDLF